MQPPELANTPIEIFDHADLLPARGVDEEKWQSRRAAKRWHDLGLLHSVKSAIKARMQESKSSHELRDYQMKAAAMGLAIPSADELKAMLRVRLGRRLKGPKPRGRLHVFLATSLVSWERVLPDVLATFGKLTVHDMLWKPRQDTEVDWIRRRDLISARVCESFAHSNSRQPVDVVVGYMPGYTISPETLVKMKAGGAIIVNFCWDDKLLFRGRWVGGRWSGPAALAREVDLSLTNAPDSCIKYMVEGGLGMFWPEAGHPEVHRPYSEQFEFDVSFVGARYGWRPVLIGSLKKAGIRVECFGRGWPNGPLACEEMVRLYSRSRINLGFSGVGYSKRLVCLKARDFEVPMSGGLYLTQDNPELSLVYEVGAEIMTYQGAQDCARKIRWILDHSNEAEAIRGAGRKRALADHTWEKRFEDLFHFLGVLA